MKTIQALILALTLTAFAAGSLWATDAGAAAEVKPAPRPLPRRNVRSWVATLTNRSMSTTKANASTSAVQVAMRISRKTRKNI